MDDHYRRSDIRFRRRAAHDFHGVEWAKLRRDVQPYMTMEADSRWIQDGGNLFDFDDSFAGLGGPLDWMPSKQEESEGLVSALRTAPFGVRIESGVSGRRSENFSKK